MIRTTEHTSPKFSRNQFLRLSCKGRNYAKASANLRNFSFHTHNKSWSPLIRQVSPGLDQAQASALEPQAAHLAGHTKAVRAPASAKAARPQVRSLILAVAVRHQVHNRRAGWVLPPRGEQGVRSVLAGLGAAGRPARARLEALGQPRLYTHSQAQPHGQHNVIGNVASYATQDGQKTSCWETLSYENKTRACGGNGYRVLELGSAAIPEAVPWAT